MNRKNGTNYYKKLARLKYKDEILELYNKKNSIDEITKKINRRLSYSKLDVTLSRSTIYKVIKKYKKD
jgi:hypothetical protein